MLGYTFNRTKNDIEIRRKQYEKRQVYQNWNRCAVEKVNREYHIIQDGIISKKDYALLFENDEGKHHIPVEICWDIICLKITDTILPHYYNSAKYIIMSEEG